MTTIYRELLEQIVTEMHTASSNSTEAEIVTEYELWVAFLKQIHPESKLFTELIEQEIREPSNNLKVVSDVREIMMIAETENYPTWFIQPKYTDTILLEYEKGELKSELSKEGIPKVISEFTGKVSGVFKHSPEHLKFIAHDIDTDVGFLEKMALLESYELQVSEYITFPTNRIPTISSSKLEMLFKNYISKASAQGFQVDGLVIISDTLLPTGSNKIYYQFN